MAENNFPVEKAPKGGEPNPFMGNDLEDNPFKIDPEKNPFKGYERPDFAKKTEPQKKGETKEAPSVFKGAYGAARTKALNWIIGRSQGYKDFRSFTNVPPAVREKCFN
jgi:hypothetical protein